VQIGLRFGLYADLMLLFGLAVYPLHAAHMSLRLRPYWMFAVLAGLGLVLSAAAFVAMTAEMAGVAITGLDRETLRFVLVDTAPGGAFLLRMAALAILLVLALAVRSGAACWPVAAMAAFALATLAWTGHAAVAEGVWGAIHRLSDAVHLMAAAAWVGALAMLLGMLASPFDGEAAVADARLALDRFAVAGSVLVALIVATGAINIGMIVGPAALLLLPDTAYGRLLIAKLLLFAAMLAFAGANRWRLVPKFAAAQSPPDIGKAARALRTSILLEAGAATIILALVAWLGTLAPPSAT